MIVHLAASLCAVLAAGPLQQEPVAAPARPTQADTARPPLPLTDTAPPPIPSTAYWPHGDDTLRTIPDSRYPEISFFRDLFHVAFEPSATGAVINGFFSRNHAIILGGFRWNGEYVVRVPDPGPSKAAYDSPVTRLNREPGVEYAAPLQSRGGGIIVRAQSPSAGEPSEGGVAEPDQEPRAVAPDTGRPPLPRVFRFPTDTSRFVAYPYDTAAVFYRDIVAIQFQDSVSGNGMRRLFARYHATIIGGLPEWPAYVVRVPDPGPSYQALDSAVSAIAHDPRVRLAFPVTFRDVSALPRQIPQQPGAPKRPQSD
jgi:hypothetical protein